MSDMSTEHLVLAGLWVAGGIVLGFAAFTFVQPLLAGIAPTPNA
jgi:hypothetical protein